MRLLAFDRLLWRRSARHALDGFYKIRHRLRMMLATERPAVWRQFRLLFDSAMTPSLPVSWRFRSVCWRIIPVLRRAARPAVKSNPLLTVADSGRCAGSFPTHAMREFSVKSRPGQARG